VNEVADRRPHRPPASRLTQVGRLVVCAGTALARRPLSPCPHRRCSRH